jgi:hypothetical protein
MRRSTIPLIAATVTGLLTLACGSDDQPTPAPTGQSIVQSAGADSVATFALAGTGTPVIHRVLLSPEVPVPGSEIRAVVEASDPDGDGLRFHYVWTYNGREVSTGDKAVLFLIDLKKGDRVQVSVTASDGRFESSPVVAKARAGNRPPVLSTVTLDPWGDIRAGEVITATPHASDPDNDSLRFKYRWFLNGNEKGRDRTLDTAGMKRGDQLQVRVVASDDSAESREVSSPVLMLGNSPPVITQLPTRRSEDGTFRYTFVARDPDGDRNLRFFLERGPTGMRMDAITGVLTWTPSTQQAGVHPIEVGVKDSKEEGTTFTFELTVRSETPAAQAPQGY